MSKETRRPDGRLRGFAVPRLGQFSAFALCCAIFISIVEMGTLTAFGAAGRIKGTVTVTTTDPIQNNLGSLRVGQFFNTLGTSVRGKFELDF